MYKPQINPLKKTFTTHWKLGPAVFMFRWTFQSTSRHQPPIQSNQQTFLKVTFSLLQLDFQHSTVHLTSFLQSTWHMGCVVIVVSCLSLFRWIFHENQQEVERWNTRRGFLQMIDHEMLKRGKVQGFVCVKIKRQLLRLHDIFLSFYLQTFFSSDSSKSPTKKKT